MCERRRLYIFERKTSVEFSVSTKLQFLIYVNENDKNVRTLTRCIIPWGGEEEAKENERIKTVVFQN